MMIPLRGEARAKPTLKRKRRFVHFSCKVIATRGKIANTCMTDPKLRPPLPLRMGTKTKRGKVLGKGLTSKRSPADSSSLMAIVSLGRIVKCPMTRRTNLVDQRPPLSTRTA